MNPQENNEGNITNSGEASSSQVNQLNMEFKLLLNSKLDEKIAALEAEKKHLITADAAWMDEMKARSAKMKEMKRESKTTKIEVQKLKQTRDGQRRVAKHMEDHVWLLKKDLKRYQEENNTMAKQQSKSLEYMENKWKEYQAKYETLPFAVVRTNEKTALVKARIELMVKEQRLVEIKQIVTQREAIEAKRRNNLAVECAELYRESKIEEDKMRIAVATCKSLEETLLTQEKTLAELAKREEQQLAAPQQLAMRKSNVEIMSLLTPVQEFPSAVRCFDLSTIGESLIQPMPTFIKDPDTESITSSVIDNLIEPRDPPQRETNEHHGQDQEQTDGVGFSDSNNNVEEDPGIPENAQLKPVPCATLRFTGMDEEEKEFERFETTPEKDPVVKKSGWPKASGAEEEAMEEEKETMEEELTNKRDEQMTGSEYWQTSCSQVQEFQTPVQNYPSEIKRPRISKTETVQLKLNPHKLMEDPTPLRENSISRYLSSSTPAGDWKVNYLSSAFSYSESQRGNADVDSVAGSVSSMQSDDFAKRFHFQFSPERENRDEYMKSIEGNEAQYATPRPSGAGPPQIGAPLRGQGFLDMGTSTSRGNKKDFISLF